MTAPPPPPTAETARLGGPALATTEAPSPTAPAWSRWLWGLLLVELVASLADIALGPWSVIGFEEGRNARAAMQLACGHADRLFDLQYRDFCGGCTGIAVVAAPVLRLLGATVAVWKLVPAAFHLGLVGAVAAVAARGGHARSALWAVAVLVASPWALRELALTGWGNHAEVRMLLLAAVALLLSDRHRVSTSLAAGLLTGLAIWFAHIAMHAVPALLLLAFLRRRRGAFFLLGVPVGLIPWALYLRARPTALAGARELWTPSALANPTDLASYLLGPLQPATLWPPTGSPVFDGMLAGSVWAIVGLAVVGTVAGVRARSRRAAVVALALGGFVAALALRPDLWADVPHAPGHSAFHLRYRAVLWPWLALGVGLAARHLPRRALLAAIPFLVLGVGARLHAWGQGPGPTLAASVWSAPGRPDATVPEGQPFRRNPWSLDRFQDIQAAAEFLTGHADPLPACTADHQGELGRRIGLHVRRGGSPSAAQLPAPDTAIVQGIAWGWTAPAGKHPQRAHGSLPPSWTTAVQTARGRLQDSDPQAPDSPGDCLREAAQAWDQATKSGRIAASSPAPTPPPSCTDPSAWSRALGVVSAERGRCPLAAGWPSCD